MHATTRCPARLASRAFDPAVPACGQTPATACQTIQLGIEHCAASGCGVLVRHGLYTTAETLRLREGVNVYGACRFEGEPDHSYRTMIRAAPPAGSPAVLADAID